MLQQRQVKMVMNPHLNLNRGNTNINNDDTLDNTVHSTSLSSSAISLDSTTDVSDVSSSFTSDNNMNLVIPSVTGGIATADVNDQSLLSHIDQYQDILPLVDNNSHNKVVKNKERPLHKSLASTLEVEDIVYNRSPLTSFGLNNNQPIVCGHRGALYSSLENTRHAFRTASQIGCDEVELDVFLLKCGTLCVFHGDGTDQNPGLLDDYSTNMKGSILDYTYEELRSKMQFNKFHQEFGCGPSIIHDLEKRGECYIPTLEEVLRDAKESNLVVKIELKGPNTALPTLDLVEKLDMVHLCHYSSFNLSQIRTIREARPQRSSLTGEYVYKTGALFSDVPENYIDLALDAGASEVHLKYSTCTKSRVEEIHRAGMDSMCWFRGPVGMAEDVRTKFFDVGNEDELMLRVVMATGVRKMCLNKPDILVAMLNRISGGCISDASTTSSISCSNSSSSSSIF